MAGPNVDGTERSTQRIEAFSDGVFAIAITLLVLDLRIPAGEGSDSGTLLNAILGLWPSYFAYGLSFTMIGIYWANHHYLFKLFAKTDHGLNLLNLLLLMFIAFLPFPTHVLGTHWPEEASRPAAVTFYALGLLLPAVAWLLVWLYASHNRRLVMPQLDHGFVHKLTLQFLGTVAVYALAVAVSVLDHRWGLAMCTGLTLLYLLPPRTPVYRRSNEPSRVKET
ncbi:TMEM175 family protein [Microvirga sp. G4-2]|uniref:TMEM175 family protein n=1 Tax=Microvirga sp. G4-2 TaxID=3434467 RepID=UPI0040443CE5